MLKLVSGISGGIDASAFIKTCESVIAREFARMLATPLHQVIGLHNDHQLLLLPIRHSNFSKKFRAPLRGETIKG